MLWARTYQIFKLFLLYIKYAESKIEINLIISYFEFFYFIISTKLFYKYYLIYLTANFYTNNDKDYLYIEYRLKITRRIKIRILK